MGADGSQKVRKGAKGCQSVPKGSKWCQNVPKRSKTLQKVLRRSKRLPKRSKAFQRVPNTPQKEFQYVSKVFQKRSKWSQGMQSSTAFQKVVAMHFKGFQCVPKKKRAKRCRSVPKGSNRVPKKVSKDFRSVPKRSKGLQMALKGCNASQKVAMHPKLLQCVPKRSKVFQSVPKRSDTFRSVPRGPKVSQRVPTES